MENKSFLEYLAESKKEYSYTLKLAVDDVDDGMLDVIETALEPYQLISASAFNKTPIQESPLDFPNVKNSPVFISKIKMSYPASRDFLETYISGELKISEQTVVVYSENDPRDLETSLHLERSAPEYKENYKPAIGQEEYEDDLTNEEASKLYGAGHNNTFLQELEAIRKEREDHVVDGPLSPPQVTDDEKSADNFNDSLPKEDLGLFGRLKRKEVK